MNIHFTREGAQIATVKATDNSYVTRNLMGDCTAFIEFYSATLIQLKSGDCAIVNGHQYFVREQVVPERDKTRLRYGLTLYGTQYELEKAAFFVIDSTNESQTPETEWDCTASQLLDLILLNLNREQSAAGWAVDATGCAVTESRTLSISNNSCLEVLQAAADLFECDYLVEGFLVKLLNSEAPASPIALEEGYTKGIRQIKANKSNDDTVITKLYAYGSAENSTDGQRLSIDPVLADNPDTIVEGFQVFDDIFPRVTATVTEQQLYDGHVVILADHYSDLDYYHIPGYTPKMKFLTGQLAGLEFDVINVPSNWYPGYGYAIFYQNISGNQVPGTTGYNALSGDVFEILNITPPPTYVDAAKAELLAAAQEYLATHLPKYKLNITLDEFYLAQNELQVEIDDWLNVKSTLTPALAAGKNVRIIGYKQFVNFPYRYDNIIVGDISLSLSIQNIIKTVKRNVTWRQVTVQTGVSYRHVQDTAAATWICLHNLGKQPAVHVTDLEGVEMLPNTVVYDSPNQVTIGFAVAVTGFADFN